MDATLEQVIWFREGTLELPGVVLYRIPLWSKCSLKIDTCLMQFGWLLLVSLEQFDQLNGAKLDNIAGIFTRSQDLETKLTLL